MSELKYGPFGETEILEFLPHRPPFLFVDKIHEVIPGVGADGTSKEVGTKVVGERTFTEKEYFYEGHFPGFKITPGVVLTECMAQVAAFSIFPLTPDKPCLHIDKGYLMQLVGVDKARFRKPVLPGDKVTITAEAKKHRSTIWTFGCRMEKEGVLVASCEIMASFSKTK